MIRDYQALQHTWFLKGKHQGVQLIGTLNYETGELFCVEKKRYDADTFLQKVLERYPNGKIAIILDHARIHHAKLIQSFLSRHLHRLELAFLPPYSPDLNLIKGLWKGLKSDVIPNVFYSSVYEIQKNVQAFIPELNRISEKVINRLCVQL